MRKRLADDRRELEDYFREVDRALKQPGKRLPNRGKIEFPPTDPFWLPMICGMQQYSLLEAITRRRAAAAMIRLMAFRGRHGRLPAADELKLPEDPFRPGKRLTFVVDKEKQRVGIYGVTWSNAFGEDKGGQKIGYWLPLGEREGWAPAEEE